jgi:hypothetical protein
MQATKSHAGNIIPAQQIHFAKPAEKKAAPVETTPTVANHQPQVTLIKDGDVVRAIEVLCSCGEVLWLDCKYV